jgi:hypothetical protein
MNKEDKILLVFAILIIAVLCILWKPILHSFSYYEDQRKIRDALRTPCQIECTPDTGISMSDHADIQRAATGYTICIQTCKQNELLKEAIQKGIVPLTKGEK